MHLTNIALVLEGGGMRGMFSAGVFEAFLLKDLTFPYITAVSAGACNILSYMSRQPLRTRKIIENYVTDKRYFSLRNWLKEGSIFGFDFIFEDLPKKLLPFDFATYYQYPGVLQVGTTDLRTGKAAWFGKEAIGRSFTPVRASSSMPFLAPVVHMGGRDLLDGALVAPIPYEKALKAGYDKLVVVLTRNAGYRKKKSVPKLLLKTVYHEYPKLWDIMQRRPALYNEQLEAVEEMERQGKAVIIRPQVPLEIDKLDIKPDKLLALHDHGIGCGLAACEKILRLAEE
ncbi:MAG: patatin family protein [Phascolarctobacterium sp.]|uniref:patatin-like phospholipase family protein n=1 Tax=Phascolarctobacterium sp. TaxID=2049039 RepID=UPI0026DD295C|nr:patatin family protein [Phascolarctobacterium sp.]MDO4921025.1 patatin family protein [Phascolarctobacterium sp.]